MTPYARLIISAAERWYKSNCVETSPNRGVCVDKIHEAFDEGWLRSQRSEAWCAKFAYVCYQQAAERLGIDNPLPQTASARGMLIQSRTRDIRVDMKPAPGAVFYRYSGAAGASGHVGIVHRVTSDGIVTIEGNLSDRVAFYSYSWSRINNKGNGFAFIHGEDFGPKTAMLAGGSLTQMALLAAAGFGTWYMTRRKGRA